MRRDWFGELGRMSGLLPEAELRRRGVGGLLPSPAHAPQKMRSTLSPLSSFGCVL
jgi:hypothetical protein